MTESQKIVFRIALENLDNAMPRLNIVSGAALGLHRSDDGKVLENKYSTWSNESDLMNKELKEAIRLLKIISDELR